MANYFRVKTIGCWLLAIGSLCACQEGREAGDLLGQWRMADSDTNYISFAGSVTRLNSIDEGLVYGNFQHSGDSLFIQCYSVEGTPSDTAIVERTFGFRPFNNIRMKVQSLSSDRLVLSKDGQTWNFCKY